jgi:pyruvate, orthophosphate dikinase
VGTGGIARACERAALRAGQGVAIILVRQDAETSDIVALESALGLLTQRGARTSHAAVVARQLGKVCLVGCEDLRIDPVARTISLGKMVFNEGDVITLDGNDGSVYPGSVAAVLVPDELLLGRLKALRKSQAQALHRKPRK